MNVLNSSWPYVIIRLIIILKLEECLFHVPRAKLFKNGYASLHTGEKWARSSRAILGLCVSIKLMLNCFSIYLLSVRPTLQQLLLLDLDISILDYYNFCNVDDLRVFIITESKHFYDIMTPQFIQKDDPLN